MRKKNLNQDPTSEEEDLDPEDNYGDKDANADAEADAEAENADGRQRDRQRPSVSLPGRRKRPEDERIAHAAYNWFQDACAEANEKFNEVLPRFTWIPSSKTGAVNFEPCMCKDINK